MFSFFGGFFFGIIIGLVIGGLSSINDNASYENDIELMLAMKEVESLRSSENDEET